MFLLCDSSSLALELRRHRGRRYTRYGHTLGRTTYERAYVRVGTLAVGRDECVEIVILNENKKKKKPNNMQNIYILYKSSFRGNGKLIPKTLCVRVRFHNNIKAMTVAENVDHDDGVFFSFSHNRMFEEEEKRRTNRLWLCVPTYARGIDRIGHST